MEIRKFYQNGYVELIFGAFLISFSAVFVKSAKISPDLAGFYRLFFGSIPLGIAATISLRKKKISFSTGSIVLPVLCGIVFFGDIFVWHKSIHFIGPGLATLLGNFQVFIVALMAFLFLNEKLGIKFYTSVPFALLGIYLITSSGPLSLDTDFGKGIALGFATSAFYAAYIMLLRYSHSHYKELNIFVLMFIISATTCSIFALYLILTHQTFAINDTKSLLFMILYGFFSQFLGWIIITHALPKVKVSIAGLLILIQPVLSYLWDILFFAKKVSYIEGAGVVIALAAIYTGSRPSKNKTEAKNKDL